MRREAPQDTGKTQDPPLETPAHSGAGKTCSPPSGTYCKCEERDP
jgi:hypothetical protein